MIVKFIAGRGGGRGAGPVDYLLKEREVEAEVVRGDPELTKELIDSLDFERKYKSGVLSFAPGEAITKEMEQDIIDRFERAAFSGLERDQYSILWVRHQDKGRCELHFVTPRVELRSGKSLNIDPPGRASRQLFDDFEEIINREYDLSHPRDLERQRELKAPDFMLKAGVDLGSDPRGRIHDWTQHGIAAGSITNRHDIISGLKRVGFEVPRVGTNYITVHDPGLGQRWRLKGEYYRDGFKSIEEVRERQGRDHSASPGSLDRATERFNRLVRERAKYNHERYCKAYQLEISRTHDIGVFGRDRSSRGELCDKSPHIEPANRAQGQSLRAKRTRGITQERALFPASKDQAAVCGDSSRERLPVPERTVLCRDETKLGEQHDRVRKAFTRRSLQLERASNFIGNTIRRVERTCTRLTRAARNFARALQHGDQVIGGIKVRLDLEEELEHERKERERDFGLGL